MGSQTWNVVPFSPVSYEVIETVES